ASVDLLAPQGTEYDRLTVLGLGKADALDEKAWHRIGGAAYAAAKKAQDISILADVADGEASADDAAAIGFGILLASYSFEKYKTKKENGKASAPKATRITILCADPNAAKKAFATAEAVADGVILARDLVNEPANILGTLEFA